MNTIVSLIALFRSSTQAPLRPSPGRLINSFPASVSNANNIGTPEIIAAVGTALCSSSRIFKIEAKSYGVATLSKDSIAANEVIRFNGSDTLLAALDDLRGGVDVPFGVSRGVGSMTLNDTPFSGLESDRSLVSSLSTSLAIALSTRSRSGGVGDFESTSAVGRGVAAADGDCLRGVGVGDPVPSEQDIASVYTVACRALQSR